MKLRSKRKRGNRPAPAQQRQDCTGLPCQLINCRWCWFKALERVEFDRCGRKLFLMYVRLISWEKHPVTVGLRSVAARHSGARLGDSTTTLPRATQVENVTLARSIPVSIVATATGVMSPCATLLLHGCLCSPTANDRCRHRHRDRRLAQHGHSAGSHRGAHGSPPGVARRDIGVDCQHEPRHHRNNTHGDRRILRGVASP